MGVLIFPDPLNLYSVFYRLKFLLSQSDIFSHFGAVKEQSLSSSGKAAASAPGRRATSSSSSAAAAAASEDLDEDEKAMLDEVKKEWLSVNHLYGTTSTYCYPIGRR